MHRDPLWRSESSAAGDRFGSGSCSHLLDPIAEQILFLGLEVADNM